MSGMRHGQHVRIFVAALGLGIAIAGCGSGSRPFGGDASTASGGRGTGGGSSNSGGSVGSGGVGSGGMALGTGGAPQGGRGGVQGTGGSAAAGRGGAAALGGRGSGGSGTGGGPAAGPCPLTLPVTPACAHEGLVCEYGQDPRPECRGRATCTNGNWTRTEVTCPAIPPAPGGCPATRDAAQGKACGADAAICSYGGLNCLCASCAPNGPLGCAPNPATAAWFCEAPNTDPVCPAVLPRLGAVCPNEGKQCNYFCGSVGARLCRGAVWTSADGGPCPRSSREVKRDIHYLDPGEIEKLARDVTRLRLATWQYKDPALVGRRHLGFIIEDQPDIAAVDKARGMVDLYGYTSMLAAALKAQEREIETLRREVEALRSSFPANHRIR